MAYNTIRLSEMTKGMKEYKYDEEIQWLTQPLGITSIKDEKTKKAVSK